MAIADELGGRIRDTGYAYEAREAKDYAKVKAYVRGLWETTQWLLDKADKDKIQVYRGIMLPSSLLASTKQERPPQGYTRLPELSVMRNGAASTTVDANVANSWNGVGVEHEDARSALCFALRCRAPPSFRSRPTVRTSKPSARW